ncbi:type IV secretion system protein [Nocardiopsis flavescens]|uniref:type IV secretion system protein n=1 Tax=Nocardiopsis flavescens TaxID=758803 RepID=UPI001160FF72|nr:type IV secretion system protein [Nocardiopsis flavescens]
MAGLALVPASTAVADRDQGANSGLNMCAPGLAPETERVSDRSALTPPQKEDVTTWSGVGWYFEHGSAGTQWHIFKSEDCFHENRTNADALTANLIWGIARWIADIVIFVYSLSMSDQATSWLGGLVTDIVHALRDGLWRPLIPLVVTCSAIYLAWVGLIRKRATLTIEHTVWMIAAVTIGIWFMASPAHIVGLASGISNAATGIFHNALTGLVIGDADRVCPPVGVQVPLQNPDGDLSEAVDIEHHSTPRDDEEGYIGAIPVTADDAVIAQSEAMYCAMLYEPWAHGVFGGTPRDNEAARLYSEQTLRAQSVTYIEESAYRGENGFDREAYDQLSDAKIDQYRAISEQIHHFYPDVWGSWSGEDGEQRVNAAWSALFGAIISGLLIFMISAAVLISKILFMIGLLLSPIFLLIGISPGRGRVILGRYGEFLAVDVFKQAFYGFLLALYLVVYRIVITLPIAWAAKVVIIGMLFAAVLIYRKRLAMALAAIMPGAAGRIMERVGQDRILGATAHMIPGYTLYRADKAARAKLSEPVGAALGAMVGGPAGAQAGAQMGRKNAERLNKKDQPPPPRNPEPAPEAPQWSARDVTPDAGAPRSRPHPGGRRGDDAPPLPLGPGGGGPTPPPSRGPGPGPGPGPAPTAGGTGRPGGPPPLGGGSGGARRPAAPPPADRRPVAVEGMVIYQQPRQRNTGTPAGGPPVRPQAFRFDRPLRRRGDAPDLP